MSVTHLSGMIILSGFFQGIEQVARILCGRTGAWRVMTGTVTGLSDTILFVTVLSGRILSGMVLSDTDLSRRVLLSGFFQGIEQFPQIIPLIETWV